MDRTSDNSSPTNDITPFISGLYEGPHSEACRRRASEYYVALREQGKPHLEAAAEIYLNKRGEEEVFGDLERNNGMAPGAIVRAFTEFNEWIAW